MSEVLDEPILSLYLNPSSGIVNVSISGGVGFGYLVFDLAGKLMVQSRLNGSENQIDLYGLNKGIYFIQINSEVKKIILF